MQIWGFASLLLTLASGDVIELHESNFDEALTSGPIFVKFYSPSCPHCMKLAPVWDKVAANGPTNVNSPFGVGDVDCAAHSSLCERFGVRGVPTLIYFREGKMYKYQGSREYADLVKFASGDFNRSQEVADTPAGTPSGVVGAATFTVFKMLKDMHAMIRFNLWAVIILVMVGFLAGSGMTFIIALIALPRRPAEAPAVTSPSHPRSPKSPQAKKVD